MSARHIDLVGTVLGACGIGLLTFALADWLFYQTFEISLIFR